MASVFLITMEPKVSTRKLALGVMLGFGVLGSIFIMGETMDDPGGLKGALMAASWFLPMVALSLLAWGKPNTAKPFVIAVSVLSVLISASLIPFGNWWGDFMDRKGPIIPLLAYAISIPLAIWCWRQPRLGSILLFAVGIAPIISSGVAFGIGFHSVSTSVTMAVLPAVICSILFWSSREDARA